MGAADDTHQARCGEGKVAVPWEFGARTASAALWMRRLRGGCRGRGRARCSAADKPVAPFAEDGDNRDGQHDRDRGVGDPQLFEIAQAASARGEFPVDGGVEPVVLEA